MGTSVGGGEGYCPSRTTPVPPHRMPTAVSSSQNIVHGSDDFAAITSDCRCHDVGPAVLILLDADPLLSSKAHDFTDPDVVELVLRLTTRFIGSAAETPPLSDQQILADMEPWQLHENVTVTLTAVH